MSAALCFQRLFRGVLAAQVEYSYSEAHDSVTTMIPMKQDLLPRIVQLAETLPFAGDWAWSISRFADAIHPDEFLFRLDWLQNEPTAVTLYCRFPSEPDTSAFQRAIGFARPFSWDGPDPSAVAASLGVQGPRGIAFRATRDGRLRVAVYFRSEQHAGTSWTGRLAAFLIACQYPRALASAMEADLRELYRPGPVGVIGVDDGESGVPRAVKFDPSNVPLPVLFRFLMRRGVLASRLEALRNIAIGLRAETATYAGIQYGPDGFLGFRLYFACEPASVRIPGRAAVHTQRTLRRARRLPHY